MRPLGSPKFGHSQGLLPRTPCRLLRSATGGPTHASSAEGGWGGPRASETRFPRRLSSGSWAVLPFDSAFPGVEGESRVPVARDEPSPAGDRRWAEQRNARFWRGGSGGRASELSTACTSAARLSSGGGRHAVRVGGFGLDGDRVSWCARVLTLRIPAPDESGVFCSGTLKGGGRSSRQTGVAAC